MTAQPADITVEEMRDTRMDDCPVLALGHRAGVYFFLSPIGEKREFKASDFTLNGMVSLFEGDMTWLKTHFSRQNKKKEDIDGYELHDAIQCLVSACAAKGLFNPNTAVRGVGVWRKGGFEDSRAGIIVHSGDLLFINGAFEKAGRMIGDVIYPAAPKISRIGDKASSCADGQRLHDVVAKNWSFGRGRLDAMLWTGFVAQAMLGGAPRWRAHMTVNGPKGSGKSFLADLLAGVLGAGAFDIKNNFTEAYLRQSMTGEARCLVLDEAEQEAGGGRVAKVIELLRHMSSKEGAKTGRGGQSGSPMSGNVTGCAYLSSVLHVPLQPTDKSRITLIKLLPHGKTDPEALAQLEQDMMALTALSPAFRRRMVDGWQRFLENFTKYRAAFMARGMDSRGADQPATLLAAKEVLLHDDVVNSDTVDVDVELAQALVEETRDDEEDGEGQRCLNHLYSAVLPAHRSGDPITLGQLVLEGMELMNNKSIGAYGLRFDRDENGEQQLLMATRSGGLDRIFHGTNWEKGAWIQALEMIGAPAVKKPQRFGGALSKCRAIPKDFWPHGDKA